MPQIYRHNDDHGFTPGSPTQKAEERLIDMDGPVRDSVPMKSLPKAGKKKRKGRLVLISVLVLAVMVTVGVFFIVNKTRNQNISDDPAANSTQQLPDEPDELDMMDEISDDPIDIGPQYPYEVRLGMHEDDGVWWLTIDGYDMVFVNKEYHLTPEFGNGLTSETSRAYDEMAQAARDAGLPLKIISGYRSYYTQQSIFQGWVEHYGSEEEANRVSARAGQSEHQTGLAIDIGSTFEGYDLSFGFGGTQTGQWLAEHAPEYGFILRYTEGMEEVTGYKYEPWHFRYVGVELAGIITSSGLCVEEFLDFLP